MIKLKISRDTWIYKYLNGEYKDVNGSELFMSNKNEVIHNLGNEFKKERNIKNKNEIIDRFSRLMREKDWLELFYNGDVYDKNNNNILPETDEDKEKAENYKKFKLEQIEKMKLQQQEYMKRCVVKKNISFADMVKK